MVAEKVLEGDLKAASHLMRALEEGEEWAFRELSRLLPYAGRAHVVGITGPPGAGKSTLLDRLIEVLRGRGKEVGAILVDPTSPFTGGAILGDRVRMQRHSSDPGVFIRSLATRGAMGGLSLSAWGILEVMDAMGKDYILLETIGVGQDEIDAHHAADTEVVVLTPAQGDDLQMLKAGLFETGHIFVINKADMEGAERIRGLLEAALKMRQDRWSPSVVLTQAQRGEGVTELLDRIEDHRAFLEREGLKGEGRRRRLKRGFEKILEHLLKGEIQRLLEGELMKLREEVEEGKIDPWAAAEEALKVLKGHPPDLPA
ncbi:MAG TPA: methylmalonyl Co-A mutase-associated GTPase MeaB [Deltaproteobacteria bacterium]|nr:methylmalonyl Co-A mutase-associated GTPase MeaB [Deltaproteobacteria bacterium]